MSGSNPNSSIPGTQPSDRQPMVWKTPREHSLSGRNDMLSNPIDQENVQGDEEVMVKSIRILLFIAAHYDYEVWQMNVKTAFLNGHLEECIYMVQPDGFVEHGHESKVCKLQRSIYGLKQASRSWNKRFDEVIKTSF
ncbi:cysteine-rich RLK (RECEPTOR-like protein kinase) 8 [Abeliophyllum distichum]|uniref:Cysteine-rich RLK (RECEPTOR-like protein kinase) 8 n=1 Tax=Abeliophyllum distichum TaxID=126358 RepID=A0ABD1RCD8_9LAMI